MIEPQHSESSLHELSTHSVSDAGAMLELSTLLNSSLDLNFILGNILLSPMGKFLITRGLVFIQTSGWNFEVRTVKGLPTSLLGTRFELTTYWDSFEVFSKLKEKISEEEQPWMNFCETHNIDVVVPMILNDRMVGIIGFGKKITKQKYTRDEITFLESISNIAASAVHNALTVEQLQQTNRRLDSKIQEMNTLFEFGREVNMTFDEQKILRFLSYALMGQLRIMRYAIYVRRGDKMELAHHKLQAKKQNKRMQRALCKLVEPIILSRDHQSHTALEEWLCSQELCVIIPMRSQQQTRGVLCLGEKLNAEKYESIEIEYLSALANITISALENARLFQETLEKLRLEKELGIAREIQIRLFPKKIPQPQHYDIAAINISSQQIGGDYYDVIRMLPHEYALAIADVSGKGIPASLLMANVQSVLRVLVPLNLTICEATARINTIINQNTSPDKFITFFWGILNEETHTFRYVNAGHNPPILMHKDGSFTLLHEGGMILGVLPVTPTYKEGLVTLEAGDYIVMYTDGVTEAMNSEPNEFGEARLRDVLKQNLHRTSSEIIEATHQAVKKYVGAAPQSDDITMVVLKRKETD